MGKTKEQRLADVHARALTEFDRVQTAGYETRMQCLQDRRFYAVTGAQWEGDLGDQFENKPKFELNKVHLSVIRIINEYRNNRVTVDFTSRDGQPDDKMADTCDGLYRADEQKSTANEAYDNAFEEGVGGGMGAWRLRAAYEDDDDDENDKQRICIEPIFDADSCVFFDLDAKRQDKADAKRCWVLSAQTVHAYIEEWDDDPATWPKQVNQACFDWAQGDIVYVAEFYEVEEKSEVVHVFEGLDGEEMTVPGEELDDDPEKLNELLATGFTLKRQKRVKRKRVHKYIMSGGRILSDEGIIAGRCIPIIPYYGKHNVIDGIERYQGHVRLAKDAQRLSNMLMSWLAEMAARFDAEKPILTPEQITGHSQMWADDNVQRYPYLLINAIESPDGSPAVIGPASYTKAPNVPPAMAALIQLAEQSLQELLGSQQAGEQMQPNLSGKAVELIQNRLDMQVFIYMDNFSKAMRRSGEVWLSMAKDLYVEERRRMKTLDNNGEPSSVELNAPKYNAETGEMETENDITRATFDVVVDVGPSSTSQRAATVRALTGIASITQDPEMQQALTLATIANLEGEGLSDMRDWARARGIRMGIIKPTEEERQQLAQEAAGQQPDPQQQYLLAAAEQAQADAMKSRADTVVKVADADLKKAQTEKTYAEIGVANQQLQIAGVETLQKILSPSKTTSP